MKKDNKGDEVDELENGEKRIFLGKKDGTGEMEGVTAERLLDFGRLEERDKILQREERWRRIGTSRYNKWYGRMKGNGIPGYLKKGWEENRELRGLD